jgi:hypothetical protein
VTYLTLTLAVRCHGVRGGSVPGSMRSVLEPEARSLTLQLRYRGRSAEGQFRTTVNGVSAGLAFTATSGRATRNRFPSAVTE